VDRQAAGEEGGGGSARGKSGKREGGKRERGFDSKAKATGTQYTGGGGVASDFTSANDDFTSANDYFTGASDFTARNFVLALLQKGLEFYKECPLCAQLVISSAN
jgi:hypothetical protein